MVISYYVGLCTPDSLCGQRNFDDRKICFEFAVFES